MLIHAKMIEGCRIQATDGDIGEVHDVLFDNVEWTVRYLVVNTGSWLDRQQVLLSPESVTDVDWDVRMLAVALTRQQVKDSPDVDSDIPVSRLQEERLRSYYAWPTYWVGMGIGDEAGGPITPAVAPGAPVLPTLLSSGDGGDLAPPAAREPESAGNPHLCSAREIRNYEIGAIDGDLGHVEDLLVDDARWTIQQIVVDTTNWWPGGGVVVAPDHIQDVRWSDRKVTVNLSREELKRAPEITLGHRR